MTALLWAVVPGCAERQSGDDLAARLQRAVEDHLDLHTVAGASVTVIIDGRETTAVSGMSDIEAARRVTRDTPFRIASIAKTYVAALALDLAEDDVVALDDVVDQWLDLPEHLASVRDATVRQLLSHTSGLSQTLTDDRDRGEVLDAAELLARIPPSACSPGKCWSYADGNYILAGLVLEAAAGEPLSKLLEDRLLVPLGLDDTRLPDSRESVGPLPPQYRLVYDEGDQPVEPHRLTLQSLPVVAGHGGAGMTATSRDLARWAEALYGGRVLEPSSLETMLDATPMRGLPCPTGCAFPYGLGVFRYTFDGGALAGHDGSSGAMVAHDRKRDVTLAITTNGGEQQIGAFTEALLDVIE